MSTITERKEGGLPVTLRRTESHEPPAAADRASLRRHNLGLVLRVLRELGPRSRAKIAVDTGLNKATVSSLVSELEERGLVRPGDLDRGTVGRPGHTIELDGRSVAGVGAEVNVNHIAVIAVGLRGEAFYDRWLPLDTSRLDAAAVLDALTPLITDALARAAERGAQVVGLTVGVAGLVDRGTGMLTVAPNLGWRNVPVKDLLTERLGRQLYRLTVDNEANLAVMAETHAGPSAERENLIVLVGEVGLGGGIVAEGRLLRGAKGYAGEIGHMMVDPYGRVCSCGRTGCWETVVGLHALLSAATDPDDPVRDPARALEERLAELNRRAEVGDARTLAAMRQVAHWLGIGLGNVVNLLNPGTVVLGGYFSLVGDWMLDEINAELTAAGIAPESGGCKIELSRLGFSAPVRGAATVSLEPVFDDPTLVRPRGVSLPASPAGGST